MFLKRDSVLSKILRFFFVDRTTRLVRSELLIKAAVPLINSNNDPIAKGFL